MPLARGATMQPHRFATRFALALAAVSAFASNAADTDSDRASEAGQSTLVEEVVVRADASVAASQETVGSASVLAAEDIELTRANHPHELLARVPGVWVSRGSGHEHLTAIRSGVLTGAGACGEFLLLENGIPIRPAGFCNVNNLFEMNTEQAAAVEVVRGPASALFGGNALHGVVNAVTATRADGWRASIEAGPYEYAQWRLAGGSERWRADAHSTSSGGYRDDTGYGQHKATIGGTTTAGGWDVTTTATATLLNQETGGFVRGFEAYDSPARRSNPNPEAYRDAWSARAASVWRRSLGGSGSERWLTATPYVRRSSMAFLQHFLPGQPLEKNAQTSAGTQLVLHGEDLWRWSAGATLEAFDAQLSERQAAATQGSAFLVATRPAGTHYDYRVAGLTLAAFYDASIPLRPQLELVASARAERNSYDYDNRHIDGNTKDDGTPCGFGGCLYTRPADRDDAYANVAGRLGLNWSPAASSVQLYAVASQGFRPPQTTELYRLQDGQTVADLKSETLRSLEAGLRGTIGAFDYDLALYGERTAHLIFRDANGFNVSDGATRSQGIEAHLAYAVGTNTFTLAASHARHRYAFTRAAGRGERIVDGNSVDTAPRWLGSAHWRWRRNHTVSEFEWIYLGEHFIDAANTVRYDGHTLFNWRGSWQTTRRVKLFARLLNLFDVAYADRADFAFGSYRYFPGLPRQAYVGVEFRSAR